MKGRVDVVVGEPPEVGALGGRQRAPGAGPEILVLVVPEPPDRVAVVDVFVVMVVVLLLRLRLVFVLVLVGLGHAGSFDGASLWHHIPPPQGAPHKFDPTTRSAGSLSPDIGVRWSAPGRVSGASGSEDGADEGV